MSINFRAKCNGEIGQLGNQQQWLDWIDDFGADILSAKDLTDEEKKGIINAVVRDILVNYDQAEKRHHLRINFRLPVLSTLGGILKENDAVLKRGKNAVKISESAESIDNTGAPEHHRSELLHSDGISPKGVTSGDKYNASNRFYLSLSVDYYSATLWTAPYSDYQQFLFDTIVQMHKDGSSYIKISQWMNDNGHLTPRGSVFQPNHAWSIHKKKRKSIERFTRAFEPQITDIGIDITKL